ncbi:MAG: glycosyltransferase [Opitutae bacterium]|jgi:glycosyltransferase involved in cell wall biosynthesis|nr:glycosyltransferase [Opitutae bacterium]
MATLLLVVPTLSSYEAFLSDFADVAVGAGHEVHVATHLERLTGCGVSGVGKESPVIFHDIQFPRGADPLALWRAARQLRQLVKQEQPDWIQAHFSVAALVAALAKTSAWPYTDCIIQGLACTLSRGRARLAAWFGERFAMLRLDAMWVLTQDDFEVVRNWNSSKARIQDAPGFGCRLDRFDPGSYSESGRIERRTELGVESHECILIYVGRLAAFKGFEKVVTAYRNLRLRGAPVRLLILGAFDALHPSGLTEEEIFELKNDSSVLMPGWQANVAEWLTLSDLCVFPSEREGMPVCLMEALCMGVPVVTSNSRGCRDVVRHGIDGLVLVNSSSGSIADAVASLLDTPHLVERMHRSAIEGCEQFDRKHFINEQLAAMEVVLAK